MRRKRRVDANQAEIVEVLRKYGCSVEVLSDVGRGVPDLLVGLRGKNYLLEVKRPGESLNAGQCQWWDAWRGDVLVVETVAQAIRLTKALASGVKS